MVVPALEALVTMTQEGAVRETMFSGKAGTRKTMGAPSVHAAVAATAAMARLYAPDQQKSSNQRHATRKNPTHF